MCGICGAVNSVEAPRVVRLMARAMAHRGPDSDGFLDRGAISLGMRRLRIIDLATGDQPIFNEDGRVAIVFNGEIYNFPDLYRELQGCGHHFGTRSDTEAIVHAYEEWGTDCPAHLRGMFAFAIFDQRDEARRRLLIARDRLGIKPLYLWQANGQLLFASEVRALLASGRVARRVSDAGLYSYLAFGSVQEPLTMVQDVVSLPPGTWLTCETVPEGLAVQRGAYWKPPVGGGVGAGPVEVRAWLADAIQSHLVSDVPLGAFLSGGLDSSCIVALASQAQPMRTFTIGFDGWPGDERPLAALVARRSHTEHTERVVSEAEMLSDLPRALTAMDQPTIDGVNSWYVSREAKRSGLTVALSGVGGDELFAGYPSFRQVPRLKGWPCWPWLAWLPGWSDGWGILPGEPDTRRKLANHLSGQMPLAHPYFAVRGLLSGSQLDSLLQPAFTVGLRGDLALAEWRAAVAAEVARAAQYDEVAEVSWLEMSQYMRSTLLRDVDMMSMAHSLEVRVPLVDHHLIEHILPVRGQEKQSEGQRKPLMANALSGLMPEEVTAHAKQTFTFPFETWLKRDLAIAVKDRILAPMSGLDAWISAGARARLWQDFEAGRTNWARPWAVYVLMEWLNLNM